MGTAYYFVILLFIIIVFIIIVIVYKIKKDVKKANKEFKENWSKPPSTEPKNNSSGGLLSNLGGLGNLGNLGIF